MNPTSFTLVIHAAPYLPTVLAAIAIRVPSFTVEDDRSGSSGGWLVRIVDLPQPTAAALLDVCTSNMVSIFSIEKLPEAVSE